MTIDLIVHLPVIGILHMSLTEIVTVRYHCGGWPEEVNTCFLNSYMVYL
jgi:hypothetical protein